MDHLVCLNSNSFPANGRDEAYRLFEDSLQGLLALNTGADRYILYYDSVNSEPLNDFLLASEFSYADFQEKLIEQGEHDLSLFLQEFDDKSPALDFVSEDILNDIMNFSFYIPNHAIDGQTDLFGLAWFLQAVLLSISTEKKWNTHKLIIARTGDGSYINEHLSLRNIARQEHGQLLYDEFRHVDIKAVCEENFVTQDFVDWYEMQSNENQHRVVDKLRLSCERRFEGGEPLFKTLTNGDGLREVRFSAYPGGAIRILFKALGDSKQAILVGFIKKSNNDGYDVSMARADKLFQNIEIKK